MLLEAAAEGLGVALARSGLMEADLRSGRLVRPLEAHVASDLGFFIVWRADNRKLARAEGAAGLAGGGGRNPAGSISCTATKGPARPRCAAAKPLRYDCDGMLEPRHKNEADVVAALIEALFYGSD